MNEFVVLPGPLARNSLILTGLTFRTFSTVVSECFAPVVGFVHETLPIRSPLKAAGSEVILKVLLTVAPAVIGSAVNSDVSVNDGTRAVQPLGKTMLNLTLVTGAPVVLVNVSVVSCDPPGVNVWSPGGVAVAEAAAMVSRATSYLAATTFACTSWSVASVGKVSAAVIAPS